MSNVYYPESALLNAFAPRRRVLARFLKIQSRLLQNPLSVRYVVFTCSIDIDNVFYIVDNCRRMRETSARGKNKMAEAGWAVGVKF